jgi:hypothetical protein
MQTFYAELYLTWAIKTQNRAQRNDASVTVSDITRTDWIRWLPNEWLFAGDPSVSADKTFQSVCALNTLYFLSKTRCKLNLFTAFKKSLYSQHTSIQWKFPL